MDDDHAPNVNDEHELATNSTFDETCIRAVRRTIFNVLGIPNMFASTALFREFEATVESFLTDDERVQYLSRVSTQLEYAVTYVFVESKKADKNPSLTFIYAAALVISTDPDGLYERSTQTEVGTTVANELKWTLPDYTKSVIEGFEKKLKEKTLSHLPSLLWTTPITKNGLPFKKQKKQVQPKDSEMQKLAKQWDNIIKVINVVVEKREETLRPIPDTPCYTENSDTKTSGQWTPKSASDNIQTPHSTGDVEQMDIDIETIESTILPPAEDSDAANILPPAEDPDVNSLPPVQAQDVANTLPPADERDAEMDDVVLETEQERRVITTPGHSPIATPGQWLSPREDDESESDDSLTTTSDRMESVREALDDLQLGLEDPLLNAEHPNILFLSKVALKMDSFTYTAMSHIVIVTEYRSDLTELMVPCSKLMYEYRQYCPMIYKGSMELQEYIERICTMANRDVLETSSIKLWSDMTGVFCKVFIQNMSWCVKRMKLLIGPDIQHEPVSSPNDTQCKLYHEKLAKMIGFMREVEKSGLSGEKILGLLEN